MIYTLTTNPAIDMNICSNGFEARKVNRTFNAVYTPNGKGLNVSFTMKHFGVDSCIMGFFGGFSGKYIVEGAQKKGVMVLPVWGDDVTRINIFLNDGQTEYKMVNEGAFIDRKQQDMMLEVIANAQDMEYLSVSGSLPRGISTDFYDELLQLCAKRNIEVILDISSPKLAELLAYKPLLIKPNDEEASNIFGLKLSNEPEIISAMHELHDRGARNILLTLGERGAYFSNGERIYYASPKPVNLLSSACAGDAALGAFLSVWLYDSADIEAALKKMAATGANVAESNALGDFANVESYIKDIKIRHVE